MSQPQESASSPTLAARLGQRAGLQAVIFDMDGVLSDTEPLHEAAIGLLLSRRGAFLSPEEYAGLVGLDNERAWEWLADRFNLPRATEAYLTEWQTILLPLIGEQVQPSPGAIELVTLLRDQGLRLGVASSSRRVVVEATLAAIGLSAAFQTIVSGDEVRDGKPDPEIYRLAASRLAVDPCHCAVVEDSPHGMLAAQAAGMWVIGLRTRYTAGLQLQADLVVGSLEDLLAVFEIGGGLGPRSSPT